MIDKTKSCPTCGSKNISRATNSIFEACGIDADYLCRDCATRASFDRWNKRPIEEKLEARVRELEEFVESLQLDVSDDMRRCELMSREW